MLLLCVYSRRWQGATQSTEFKLKHQQVRNPPKWQNSWQEYWESQQDLCSVGGAVVRTWGQQPLQHGRQHITEHSATQEFIVHWCWSRVERGSVHHNNNDDDDITVRPKSNPMNQNFAERQNHKSDRDSTVFIVLWTARTTLEFWMLHYLRDKKSLETVSHLLPLFRKQISNSALQSLCGLFSFTLWLSHCKHHPGRHFSLTQSLLFKSPPGMWGVSCSLKQIFCWTAHEFKFLGGGHHVVDISD